MDSVPFADGRIVVLPYDCLARIDLARNPGTVKTLSQIDLAVLGPVLF
mgnify:FL=1|jgi:hypothetical protein